MEFFKIPINYSVITNIDYEHIDYYGNLKIENSFIKYRENALYRKSIYVLIIKIKKY